MKINKSLLFVTVFAAFSQLIHSAQAAAPQATQPSQAAPAFYTTPSASASTIKQPSATLQDLFSFANSAIESIKRAEQTDEVLAAFYHFLDSKAFKNLLNSPQFLALSLSLKNAYNANQPVIASTIKNATEMLTTVAA